MVVDLLGQSGLAAHLYRRIPIIALSIFCPPSGGQRRPPPTASPSPPASCPNTEGADGPGTGASPLLPTDPERTGGVPCTCPFPRLDEICLRACSGVVL